MTFEEAMAYLEMANSRGIRLGLNRLECLLSWLHHPENACNVIHVAGTNGKGSVCSYIASVLEEAGYVVGRYISPSVYGYCERIQINGTWITKEEVAEYLTRLRTVLEQNSLKVDSKSSMDSQENTSDGHINEVFDTTHVLTELPTAFELETAMAFLYFKEKNCDFVVLETGMGGRLDATNVVLKPLLSVITSIAMDHMQFLGENIAAIAGEKGGIIKNGRPAIIGTENPMAVEVLENICKEKKAPCKLFKKSDVVMRMADVESGQRFDYKDMKELHTVMLGNYQPENAALAIEVLKALSELKKEEFIKELLFYPSECLNRLTVYKGISCAKWSGRFEVIAKEPYVIVDGAHNSDGVKALKASVKQYFRDKKILLVMGVFADKDYTLMLQIVSELSDTLITFTPENARGLSADALAEVGKQFFANVLPEKSQEKALKKAFALSDPNDVIISFGSLSTVAGLNACIRKLKKTDT